LDVLVVCGRCYFFVLGCDFDSLALLGAAQGGLVGAKVRAEIFDQSVTIFGIYLGAPFHHLVDFFGYRPGTYFTKPEFFRSLLEITPKNHVIAGRLTLARLLPRLRSVGEVVTRITPGCRVRMYSCRERVANEAS
jgi:hypothetical protein